MKGTRKISIQKIKSSGNENKEDCVIEESPLQIIIAHGNTNNRKQELLSVTMRTPGDDFNLVSGFLFCEGIIKSANDILSIRFIGNPADETLQENTILVELVSTVVFNLEDKKRNFISAASCGFCGKTNADMINQQVFAPIKNSIKIHTNVLYTLPQLLNTAQNLFTQTGGAHAVALINTEGKIIHTSEDVGRHNAMDKLVGAMLKKNALLLSNYILLFSGRLGYELLQKSLMAGISIICSIGAPSSLAVEMAEENGITLIGFLKNNSFNIYCGAERIIQS